jgi:hypothetical protein
MVTVIVLSTMQSIPCFLYPEAMKYDGKNQKRVRRDGSSPAHSCVNLSDPEQLSDLMYWTFK